VRDRLRALAGASASVVLFGEFIPQDLSSWLADQIASGTDAAAATMLESQLLPAVAFMNANGLTHFDAHFGNVLTDGQRLYLADLGLASSPRFDLSPEEARFLRDTDTHDMGYAVMRLVNWLVTIFCGVAADAVAERNAYVRACAEGAEPVGAPAAVAAVVRRYAGVAAAMNDFYWDMFGSSRATPYPAEEVRQLTAAAHDGQPIRLSFS
jgi:hypothetical protein